jgi:hypothetical protein
MNASFRCYKNLSVTHTLKEFQSLWDGEKFNIHANHSHCLIKMLSKFEDKQIDYIFEHFEGLLLNHLDVIFNSIEFNLFFVGLSIKDEIHNKLFQKGLQIKGIKEYIETNIIQIIKRHSYDYSKGFWIPKVLKELKIRIEPEKLKNVDLLRVIISLFDNNPLYKFREKVKVINDAKQLYYSRSSLEARSYIGRFEKVIILITVRELQYRYQRRKINEVKKIMITLGIIRDLTNLIFEF